MQTTLLGRRVRFKPDPFEPERWGEIVAVWGDAHRLRIGILSDGKLGIVLPPQVTDWAEESKS